MNAANTSAIQGTSVPPVVGSLAGLAGLDGGALGGALSGALTSMRTTWPMPGGNPNPKFETYSLPSGPKVIAVGNVRPVATGSNVPLAVRRTTWPEPAAAGPGKPGVVSVSRAYSRPWLSKLTHSTEVTPRPKTSICPLGVIL